MKNQHVRAEQSLGKRRILAAILITATLGILLFLGIWFSTVNKSGEENTPDNTESSPDRPTIAQNEIGPDETLFYINGKSIKMSEFCYYLYDSFSRLESMYQTNELNFSSDMGGEMTLGQYALKNSVDGVKFSIVVEKLAEELSLNRAEAEAEVSEYLATTIAESFGGDESAFRDQLALIGTTLETFRDLMLSQKLGGEVFEHYYGEKGTVPINPSDYYDRFATVSNILLLTIDVEYDEATGERIETPLSDEAIALKRELAKTIIERLNAGEDYNALLEQYGEDPGINPDVNPAQSYTVQRNEVFYDYAVASFSMEVGEYSDIIETSYGLFIIYKLSLDTEKVKEVVNTPEFRSGLFNTMLDSLSGDYSFEPTPLFEGASLDSWYWEYKDKNYQMFN